MGSQTIEVLQEMFGVVGFWDPGHGREWRDIKAAVCLPSHEP